MGAVVLRDLGEETSEPPSAIILSAESNEIFFWGGGRML